MAKEPWLQINPGLNVRAGIHFIDTILSNKNKIYKLLQINSGLNVRASIHLIKYMSIKNKNYYLCIPTYTNRALPLPLSSKLY